MALFVLIGASLFLESFRHTKQIDPGFDPSHVLLAPLNLTEAGYSTEQGTLFMRHLRDRIEALPGVRAVSFADNVPLGFADGPKGRCAGRRLRTSSRRGHASLLEPDLAGLLRSHADCSHRRARFYRTRRQSIAARGDHQ